MVAAALRSCLLTASVFTIKQEARSSAGSEAGEEVRQCEGRSGYDIIILGG